MIPLPTPSQIVQYTERGKQWPFLVTAVDVPTGRIDGWSFTDRATHVHRSVPYSQAPTDEHWQATRVADGPFG